MAPATIPLDNEWRVLVYGGDSWVVKVSVISGDVWFRPRAGDGDTYNEIRLVKGGPVALGGMVQLKADGDKPASIEVVYERLR